MRKDFRLFDDAPFLILASVSAVGRAHREANDKGWVLRVDQTYEHDTVVRIVTGELTAEEEAAWVRRVEGYLDLSSGHLAFRFDRDLFQPYQPETGGALVEVRPGCYRVTCYQYLPLAIHDLDFRGDGDVPPDGATWFLESRPYDDLPWWFDWAGLDMARPGSLPASEFSRHAGSWVGWLVHLTPLAAGEGIPGRPGNTEVTKRYPEPMPLGLSACKPGVG